jgi:hypothetical protein
MAVAGRRSVQRRCRLVEASKLAGGDDVHPGVVQRALLLSSGVTTATDAAVLDYLLRVVGFSDVTVLHQTQPVKGASSPSTSAAAGTKSGESRLPRRTLPQ